MVTVRERSPNSVEEHENVRQAFAIAAHGWQFALETLSGIGRSAHSMFVAFPAFLPAGVNATMSWAAVILPRLCRASVRKMSDLAFVPPDNASMV